MASRQVDPVDVHVGNLIKVFRLKAGITQMQLARKIGVTFQQVQKYEKGVNRVGAGRLTKIAQVLGVSVSAFFDSIEYMQAEVRGVENPLALLANEQNLRLLLAFAKLKEDGARRAVLTLLETMAASRGDAPHR